MIMTVHTDGGARGNPGPAAIGAVIVAGNFEREVSRCIGNTTNNVAEYTAVLDALAVLPEVCAEHPTDRIDFFLDSQLVVFQISGKYKVKEPTLQVLCARIKEQLTKLPCPTQFHYVPRAQNARADRLVNQALDSAN
jgi:ribonuclease HI